MKDALRGRTAVVTGGTRGIGRAIALRLAEDGARVFALFARDRKSAEALTQEAQARQLEIHCLRGDLTNEGQRTSLLAQLADLAPQVDILVHSAASGVHRPVDELSDKHLRWTFDINFFAVHALTMALLPRIPNGGRVIGITSAGSTRTIPFYAAVGSSKAAFESLLRHYAVELAPKGIAVNCVCAGLVPTDAVEAFPDRETRLDEVRSRTPSTRLTSGDDVACLVRFLCGPESAQIIGQTLVVDGGKTLSS